MERYGQILLVAMPIFLALVLFEKWYGWYRGRDNLRSMDMVSSLSSGVTNVVKDVLGLSVSILTYGWMVEHLALVTLKSTFWMYAIAFLALDFQGYWVHRWSHEINLFWNRHIIHHSSEEFNLTVGFRSSVLQPLYRFIYFIPLSIVGFKAIDIMFIYSATQIFGILVHTQTVGKLGWLEYFLVTPSHHRVHHASNVCYLDRNMGMVLIIWDKLFGTFQRELENEPIKYGLTNNLHSNNPGKIVFHEWQAIAHDLKKKTSVKNKIMYLLGPPGWSHDGDCKTSAQLRKALLKKK